MLISNITQAIGSTPLLEIPKSTHGLSNLRLYAKLEHLNPWGSVKDRTAWYLLREELARLQADSGKVIESTSGNTGKAMQMLCGMRGIPFELVTNRIHVPEIKELLLLLGTKVLELPGTSSCPDPSDPNNPFTLIERMMSSEPDTYYHASQYFNPHNVDAHYETTGPEIDADAGAMDFFFAGLGTAGSSRGVGRFLKEQNPHLKMIGIIAYKGDILPGIRNGDEMAEVGLFDHSLYDEIVEVSQDAALDAMLLLIRELGVLGGPTSGAAYAATLQYLRTIDASLTTEHKACFIVPDRVEPYLSFLKKVRPQLFSLPVKKDSPRTISAAEAASARTITAGQAKDWLDDPGVLVVDLRGSLGFKSGHMPGSLNYPEELLVEQCERGAAPFTSGRRILFVCPIGKQSLSFVAYFQARGIDCASLAGGFTAWREAGGQINRASPPVNTSTI